MFVLLLVAARRVLRALRRWAGDKGADGAAGGNGTVLRCAGGDDAPRGCAGAEYLQTPSDGAHPPDAATLAESLADLGTLLREVRAQRAGCVQTPEQYAFAHRALAAWVRVKLDACVAQGAAATEPGGASASDAQHGPVAPRPLPY